MGVEACKQRCSTWCTEGIGDEHVFEIHTLRCQPIHIRRLNDLIAGTTHGIKPLIVAHHDDDIGLLRSHHQLWQRKQQNNNGQATHGASPLSYFLSSSTSLTITP